VDAITTSVDVQSINNTALFSQCDRQLKNSLFFKTAAAADGGSFCVGQFFSSLMITALCVSFVIVNQRQFWVAARHDDCLILWLFLLPLIICKLLCTSPRAIFATLLCGTMQNYGCNIVLFTSWAALRDRTDRTNMIREIVLPVGALGHITGNSIGGGHLVLTVSGTGRKIGRGCFLRSQYATVFIQL